MTMKALEYLKQGYAPIPVGKDKKPLAPWKDFQKQPPTHEQIVLWDTDFASGGIGLITGERYRTIVVDIDPRNGGNESLRGLYLPQTMIVKTGGGGFHYYYRWPEGFSAPSKTGYRPGIDIQGDGKYVVAPPSVHLSGSAYEVVVGETGLAEAPEWLFALGDGRNETRDKLWKTGKDGVIEGGRNATAASFAGKLFRDYTADKWESGAWPEFVEWNRKNMPPLEEHELRSVFESIQKLAEEESLKKPSDKGTSPQQIYDHLSGVLHEVFTDEFGQAYAVIPADLHNEVMKVRSDSFRRWSLRSYWRKMGKMPGTDTLKTAVELITADAVHSEDQRTLSTRVGLYNGAFWYDLSNKAWSVIKVQPGSWEIVSEAPAIFYRYKHQRAQVTPIGGGDLWDLLKEVNIQNPKHRLLFLVYLVSCFIPGIAHPIPILFGSQGSAKTTLFRMVKRIVDPSALEVLSLPANATELVQNLAHHWLAPFDNISSMPQWMCDRFCRASTGEGFSKRELYSDDEDVIYSFRHCVALNGINIASDKPDLLDRSILIGLERIDPKSRKDEETIWKEFEAKKPFILGAIFDVLAGAMKLQPDVKPGDLPRMADFAKWGCAIARMLGQTDEAFLTAYRENIEQQNDVAIRENIVASTIQSFMSTRDLWEGTMTELLTELTNQADQEKVDVKARAWPKGAQALSRAINVAKVNLAEVGIEIETIPGVKRIVRMMKIVKLEALFHDATDGIDAIIPF